MSLLSSASAASCWRGYEYFRQKKVLKLEQLGDVQFQATVTGSRKAPYMVTIDLAHPRRSSCNCPHAEGRQIICKHMVAAFFTAFPDEAEKYYDEILAYEEENERYQEALTEKVIKYIRGLKRKEAQDKLLEVLGTGPDWLWDQFIRDNIEE